MQIYTQFNYYAYMHNLIPYEMSWLKTFKNAG